jgi:polyhydroxybutyrate depolymerase
MVIGRFIVVVALLLQALCWTAHADDLTVTFQGIDRHVLLHAPPTTLSGKSPVMIFLHGVRPSGWVNHTLAEADALADREGFLAIYPEAVGQKWNFANNLKEPQRIGEGVVDDVGFIKSLIARVVAERGADPSRVYVIGDSRGALMVYSLMCQLADEIAAAAPLISGMTSLNVADCNPSRAVPLMVVGGTNDRFQSYDGFLGRDLRLLSVPETMEFWRVRHGCTGQQVKLLPHRELEDRTRLVLSEWTGCKADGAVKLYRVSGGGHQVPSFAPGNPDWIKQAGPINHDIETVDEFWQFAKNFHD